MADQSHYKEILLALSDANVEFLIVGGYAVMHYAEPRFTKYLDLWVRTSIDNSFAIYTALAAFGAPLKADGIEPDTFIEPDIVYQIGTPPIRVDLSTHIDGVEFENAWSRKTQAIFFGVPVYVISIADLIRNKEAVGRPRDKIDIESLKKV